MAPVPCRRQTPTVGVGGLAKPVLGAAGTVPSSRGDKAVALLSEVVSERTAGAPLAASQAGGGFPGTGIVTWLILAAIVLLGVEWYLYQRGLMP